MAEVILDRLGIEARIPHAPPMCLLESVRYCGPNGIECRARLAAPHPLMRNGQWPSTTAIEFAAQAMALHGAMLAEQQAQPGAQSGNEALRAPQGFIAGLRSVRMEGQYFPPGLHELHIEAERISGDDLQVMYGFSVRGVAPQGCELASGRAIVVLDAQRFAGARKPAADPGG